MVGEKKVVCALGVDCGSVSVKIAVLDENDQLVASSYHKNQGLKDTILTCLVEIKKQTKQKIMGVGVTGSGRQFAKILLNADLTKTEILAHVTATKHHFPKVRTVMDIGGEDSKLITLNEDGIWTNYVMNSICSAGCGSMLVNIANNLGVQIEDVDTIALKSTNKINIPSKCGILCNSAIINYKNKGVSKEDLLMGACRALIKNFMLLARNVNTSPPYVFQGATAKNKALIRALEEELKQKVNVPKYPELMGAIGMAMLCKQQNINKEFEFDLNTEYETQNIQGDGCPNNCEITILLKNNQKIGSVGNRCEKCAK